MRKHCPLLDKMYHCKYLKPKFLILTKDHYFCDYVSRKINYIL